MPLHALSHACGKVILLGEHAVVHGFPALAAGLPDGLTLEAVETHDGPGRLRVPSWEVDVELHPDNPDPVARAATAVLMACGASARDHTITGRSSLPCRAGLGSSAALSVALARLALPQDADDEAVVKASLAGEAVFHGAPSGVDSQVAARGGVLFYVRGREPEVVATPKPLRLVLASSGVPRATSDVIQRVYDRVGRFELGGAMSALGGLAALGRTAIEESEFGELGELMDVAHELLTALGAGHPRLDALVSLARDAGAEGAKLTGAGGGGCAVALAETRFLEVGEAWRRAGVSPISVEVRA